MALDSNTHSPLGSSSRGTLPNGFFARNAGVLLSTPIWKGSTTSRRHPGPTRGRLDAAGAPVQPYSYALVIAGRGAGEGGGARGTSANQRRERGGVERTLRGRRWRARAGTRRDRDGEERNDARGWRLSKRRAREIARAGGKRAAGSAEERRDETSRGTHHGGLRAGRAASRRTVARAAAGARDALPPTRRTARPR